MLSLSSPPRPRFATARRRCGALLGIAVLTTGLFTGATSGATTQLTRPPAALTASQPDAQLVLRVVGGDGTVYEDAQTTPFTPIHNYLQSPIVGGVERSAGEGYWLVSADGGVYADGGAPFLGSAVPLRPAKPIVGIASSSDGKGYWLVAADGGVFAFGSAKYYGSAADRRLASPIVGIAATPSGHGYLLVSADGGVFTYGDSQFVGSASPLHLNQPVVAIGVTPDGGGYWLAARDGGVFSFGTARYLGSHPYPRGLYVGTLFGVVAIVPTRTGHGYWIVGRDGQITSFGDATVLAAGVSPTPDGPIVSALGRAVSTSDVSTAITCGDYGYRPQSSDLAVEISGMHTSCLIATEVVALAPDRPTSGAPYDPVGFSCVAGPETQPPGGGMSGRTYRCDNGHGAVITFVRH